MKVSKMKWSMQLLFILVLSCSLIRSENDKKKCNVLALEGGGDKGAYQAGAIKGLVDNIPNGESKWDVVTGISVGSLNAAGLAIFPVGEESQAADYLLETWREIKGAGDIYQNWFAGPIEGLLLKSGLFDTSPLRKKLQDTVRENKFKRKFVCGATNFATGTYDTWDESNLNREEYISAIVSSAAFPVLFPLSNFEKESYMDGGVKVSVDIASGINKCIELGFDDEDIVVDVILLNSKVLSSQPADGVHPLGILIRIMEIYGYDSAMKDFDYIKKAFPSVHFRYTVAPRKPLPSGPIPLVFSPSEIETMINYGIEDATLVVQEGPGVTLNNMLKDFNHDKEKLHGRKQKRIINNTEEVSDLEVDFLK